MKRKIYVTEAGYDDIGSILNSLGEGYKYEILSLDLDNFDKLTRDDILFINCHSSCVNSPSLYKEPLRNFVSCGGIVYASDWAGALIAQAFGDYLEFNDQGIAQTLDVDVIDAGLGELLGTQISLNFDMTGWWQITKVKKEMKTLLAYKNEPILVSFKVNQGHVLYTSFHNKSQVSKVEKALLEYLVFRPLLSKVADQALEQVTAAKFILDKEIIASTTDKQKNGYAYDLYVDKPVTILCILSWEGPAKFEMVLQNSKHISVKKMLSDQPSVGIEFFAQETGVWTVLITPISVPYPNFPFALTFARGGENQNVINTLTSQNSTDQVIANANSSKPALPISKRLSIPITPGLVSNPVIGKTSISTFSSVASLLPPVLFPILNMGGLSIYDVRWMPQADHDGCILQEALSGNFSDAIDIYQGTETLFACKNKTIGQYHYRILAYRGAIKSAWSDPQSTRVINKL